MATEKSIFRAYAPNDLIRLIKVLAELKESNLSESLTEALYDWLQRPENQDLIKKHNLTNATNNLQQINS